MFVIEFKLDPQLDFWGNFPCDTVLDDISIPVDGMKKHVISEVFGLDETVSAFFFDEHDLAKSSPLNAKLFLDPIFLVGVVHGLALAAGLLKFVASECAGNGCRPTGMEYPLTSHTARTTLV